MLIESADTNLPSWSLNAVYSTYSLNYEKFVVHNYISSIKASTSTYFPEYYPLIYEAFEGFFGGNNTYVVEDLKSKA